MNEGFIYLFSRVLFLPGTWTQEADISIFLGEGLPVNSTAGLAFSQNQRHLMSYCCWQVGEMEQASLVSKGLEVGITAACVGALCGKHGQLGMARHGAWGTVVGDGI